MDSEAVRIRALVVECCEVLEACRFAGPADPDEAGTLEALRSELLLLSAGTQDRDAAIDAVGVVGLVDDVLSATPISDDPDLRAAS